MEIYYIYAGDYYGIHNEWILTHEKEFDLDELYEKFINLKIPDSKKVDRFGHTEAFVQWLQETYKMVIPGTYNLYTEN